MEIFKEIIAIVVAFVGFLFPALSGALYGLMNQLDSFKEMILAAIFNVPVAVISIASIAILLCRIGIKIYKHFN